MNFLGVAVEMGGLPTVVLHITSRGTPLGRLTVPPPQRGKERLVKDDMTLMGVECFGKLSLLMHCQGGYTHVRLTSVAYVLGVQLNLFSLHAVMSKCRVTMDNKGVHMLGGSASFVRKETGAYCSANKISYPLMANAVLVPGEQQRIDINDLHVALAHPHAATLRESARQHGVEVVGELFSCAGCSEAKGRRMPVPRPSNSRANKPFERLFVDLSGERPASSGGYHYLMMIADDFSWFGWTYVRKEKSDVPAVFAVFLADIRVQGTPSIVACIHSDNCTECTKSEFVTLLDHHCIRREYTPEDSPKYDGVVERRIALALEAAISSCLEAPHLFGGVPLPRTWPLWAEGCVHASDAINVSASVSEKPDMLSPYQNVYGRAPFSRLLPFLEPGFHHVKRALKSEPKAQVCLFLNSGSNHMRDFCKVLLMSGRRSYPRDVTWEHPREAFAGLLAAAWGKDTSSPGPSLSEARIPSENGEVWCEPAPMPSRTSLGTVKTSLFTSRASQVTSQPSSVPSQPSPVPSMASPESAQPPPVWTSRTSPAPSQPSGVPSRESP